MLYMAVDTVLVRTVFALRDAQPRREVHKKAATARYVFAMDDLPT